MKQRPPSKELIATAYHEAGHAVVSSRLGSKVKHVSIVPNERTETLGHVRHQPIPRRILRILEFGFVTPVQRQLVEDHIIISYAGSLAERRQRGRSNHRGAQSDYADVVGLADRLCGSAEEVDAYLAWLRIRATNSVNANWDLIESVAQALLARQKLSGDELHEVIQAFYDARLAASPAKVHFPDPEDA